jgi:predicted ATPase
MNNVTLKEFEVIGMLGVKKSIHKVSFDSEQRVKILYGINGAGKTTFLRILEAVFSRSIIFSDSIQRIEFDQINISFSNGNVVAIRKTAKQIAISFKKTNRAKQEIILRTNKLTDPRSYDSIEICDGYSMERGGTITWPFKYHISNKQENLESYFSKDGGKYSEEYWLKDKLIWTPELKKIIADSRSEKYAKLKIFNNITICTLYTDRLNLNLSKTVTEAQISNYLLTRERVLQDNKKIIQIKNDMVIRNQKNKEDFDEQLRSKQLDEEIDANKDLVENIIQTIGSYTTFGETVKNFMNAGYDFVSDNDEKQIKKINESLTSLKTGKNRTKNLDLEYIISSKQSDINKAKDVKDYIKHSFDWFRHKSVLHRFQMAQQHIEKEVNKINTFLKVVNSKLYNKFLKNDYEEGLVCYSGDPNPKGSKNNKEIPLEKLSSGEQHTIIMDYIIAFRLNNSVLLMDEPEISLHIDWQRCFIKNLLDFLEGSNSSAIIATHSPTIIGSHRSLLQQLPE